MIFFDIETGPESDDNLRTMLPEFIAPPHPGEFNESSVKVGNLKDADKIAAKIAQARADHAAAVLNYSADVEDAKAKHFADFRKDAALSPLTGKVLCIGIYPDSGEPMVFDDANEAALIGRFWKAWEDSVDEWAGWNVLNFDLPFLIRRSWRHGLKVPNDLRISQSRYWNPRFVDLMDRFAGGKWGEKIKLDQAAKFLGVGTKTGNGADFAELWQADRLKALAYLINDLNITAGIAERMGLTVLVDASMAESVPF